MLPSQQQPNEQPFLEHFGVSFVDEKVKDHLLTIIVVVLCCFSKVNHGDPSGDIVPTLESALELQLYSLHLLLYSTHYADLTNSMKITCPAHVEQKSVCSKTHNHVLTRL